MPKDKLNCNAEKSTQQAETSDSSSTVTPQSETFFLKAFENHSAVMLLIDAESGHIIDANQAATEFYGWPIEQLKSKNINEIDAPSWTRNKSWLMELATQERGRFASMHRCANGMLQYVEVSFGTTKLQDKTVLHFIMQENGERQYFEALTKFRHRLLELAEHASTEELLNFTINEAERLTGSTLGFFNFISEDHKIFRHACSNLAKTDNCGHAKPPIEIDPELLADVISQKKVVINNDHASIKHCNSNIASHQEAKRELIVPIIRNDKLMATLELANKPTDYDEKDSTLVSMLTGVAWDIIARKHAEESEQKMLKAIQHTQNMDSIGRLAGGIAHDINNGLAVILGHTEIVLEQVSPKGTITENLQHIKNSTVKAANLIQQLLAFARKQTIHPKILELDATLLSKLPYLRKLIGEQLNLEWHPDSHDARILIDPLQLDQIMISLCENARDAITDTGTVRIETATVRVKPSDCYSDHPCQTPGLFAMISVIDTGCGMDEKVMSQIFDPFFTTKDVGKGSGLGLSTVYGIVKQNKGYLNCQSNPGNGSRFTIYLPVVENKIEPDKKITPKDVASPDDKQTILVVDDNGTILYIVKTVLEKNNYRVLSTTSAQEAINIVTNSETRVDLLLTDVVMPEMSGQELSKKLISILPHLKTIFMSGFSKDLTNLNELAENERFISKPFKMREFTATIKAMLS